MATITDTGFPTLLNVLKRLKPGGGVETQIAELLSKELPLLEDIPWVQGDLETGMRITSRTGLPTPFWRMYNQGVPVTKSRTAQYDETCGMLEDLSKVDVDLADNSGDAAAYRKTEDDAKAEGFAQEAGRSIFYESSLTAPQKIHGLSPRYAATSGYTSSGYVFKEGTVAGVNAQSVWLINWSPSTVFGIYPKHSVAGLRSEDLGRILTKDYAGVNEFMAYVTRTQWKLGVGVKDYRHAVRMQWDPDDTAGFASPTGKGMYLALQKMLNKIKKVGSHCRFYMSRDSKTLLDSQLAANDANFLTYMEMGGRQMPHFNGVPIRIDDTLVGETPVA